MTNSIQELEDAKCIFITGSNTTSSHPIIASRIFRAKEKGAKVIVADPCRIQIGDLADIQVHQKLGTDVALLNGIMHVILQNGWEDREFIDNHTEGFEEFQKEIQNYTPEKVAELTNIDKQDIEKIAEHFALAEASSIVYCMGITQHTTGVDNVKSLANLAMLTGNVGKYATGVNPLRGQNNVQGACDMGGLPNVFTGYQAVTNEDINQKFSRAWNAELSNRIGLAIPEMMAGLEDGSLKALYVMGENPVMSDPDCKHVRKALQNAELLVVQDIFLNETAELADVVLPGASFAEKDGTFTNTERRVTRVRQAIEPVGESRSDWEIIQDLSNKLGYSMQYSSAEEIMQEIAEMTPSYGGITFERLEGEGLQWPCTDQSHPGTKYLHKDGFARGKGKFHPIEFKAPAETVDEEYPLWLTTGRVFAHYHTGTMTRNSPTLNSAVENGFIEINPADADKLQISQEDKVHVSSRRGNIEISALVTNRVEPGTVFLPFHFVESNANVLTNPAIDPIAKIPEYKVCAVKLDKAS